MTDDSKFVLRWKIDNAKARVAIGRMESEVFDKGGFKWTLITEKDANILGKTQFALKCDTCHTGEWKCEAKIGVYRKNGSVFYEECEEQPFCFNANSDIWIHESSWDWSTVADLDYLNRDKTLLEFHINILSCESGELIVNPGVFAAPNEMSNVILKIGDEKLHVSKEFLSVHSPVFKTMFFGDFAEKGKEEVDIKDVVYEEFIDLLHLIYLRTMNITDRTVLHIIKLSHRFQMEFVLNQAILHFIDSKKFDMMAKLLVADQYNLSDLKEKCLKSFVNITELHNKILTSPQCVSFSAEMKAGIFDRMVELKPQ